MSWTIEMEKCNFSELVTNLCEKYKIENKELLEKILLEFGEKIGETYVIMHNEVWEDGICTWNCFQLINRVFGIKGVEDNSYDEFLHLSEPMISYKTIGEAIENLGLEELISEEE